MTSGNVNDRLFAHAVDVVDEAFKAARGIAEEAEQADDQTAAGYDRALAGHLTRAIVRVYLHAIATDDE